jgi:hypothetical protein
VPRQVDDIAALSETLGSLLQVDPAEIRATIAPRPSDETVVIASLRQGDLAPIELQLRSLVGVDLVPSSYPLPPNDRFARALLGRSGEVTAEIIDEHPDLFQPGDVAGRSGLQREYNSRLSGVAGFQIRVERRFPSPGPAATTATTAPDGAGDPGTDPAVGAEADSTPDPAAQLIAELEADPDVVYLEPPVPGEALQLTIDARIQQAAEEALALTDLTSSLVAIQPSTGAVLAVANGPGAAANDFALTGQYPPGSVFKVVTAYAAMERGVSPGDRVDCPQTLEVNGRVFRNAEDEVLGTVPMRRPSEVNCRASLPIVVVLPVPLTPTTSMICGRCAASIVSGMATGRSVFSTSSARIALTASAEMSRS